MSEQEPNKTAKNPLQDNFEPHQAAAMTVAFAGPAKLSIQQALDMWDQLVGKVARLLSERPIDSAWVARLTDLTGLMRAFTSRDPNLALYVLIEANGSGANFYSAHHAMICMVMAELAAERLEWPEGEKQALALAALSMNLSMTTLQDSLARQNTPLSDSQNKLVSDHAANSVQLLSQAGVVEPMWLYIVENHHNMKHQHVAEALKVGPVLAELLRRVDIYTAKLSRRGLRQPVTPDMAARETYVDAGGKPDSISATLLKVVGIYPPGTFVELANGEIAMVVERGEKFHTPIVVSLRNQNGELLKQPVRRDTAQAGLSIKKSVESNEMQISLDRRLVLSYAV